MGGDKRKRSLAGLLLPIVGLICFFAVLAADTEEEPPSDMSPSYDLYVTFEAKTDCVPEKGPYLTKLRQDLLVQRIRFIFRKRKLDGVGVNWFPHYGAGDAISIPVLTFMEKSKIECELCPHIKCDKEIKKAWFTKQNRSCMAVLSVVPIAEIAEVSDEILDLNELKNLDEGVVPLERHVLYVKIMSHDSFAWTGECIVRQQDAGSTGDLELYLGLPARDLRLGRKVYKEFPFHSDSIDAEGTLMVRLMPLGKP